VNAYVRLVYRNIRANLDRTSLFFELVFPLFFIFVEGYGYSGIVQPIPLGNGTLIPYQVYLAAGAVTLTVINGGTNAGTQLWYDRKNGMFEQILMGPFNRAQYIMGIVLATLIIGIAGSLLVFGLAFPVLGYNIAWSVRGVLLVVSSLVIGTVFFGGLAIALSVALRSSETFQIVSSFVFFVFLFTSSVFFPSLSAPEPIRTISLLNPLTYTADIFRAGLFGLSSPLLTLELPVLAAEAMVIFAVAVFAFRRIRV
jgi:ABC-2 type transport system permease protein